VLGAAEIAESGRLRTGEVAELPQEIRDALEIFPRR
jgi:hypothetical protein